MKGPIHSKVKNIESIYPLSPMQEGMLFHSQYAPESGVYFEQLVYTISGNLNISAFKQAWKRVVDRHAALRTLFVWENLERPLQIVQKQVNLPWSEYNWQLLSSTEQEKQLENLLIAEQKQGFKLDKAPLMRFILIQINKETFQFIWNSHHLLIDGWSTPIVLKEAFAFYEVLDKGEDVFLEPARPYEDYIDWLQKQDFSQAEVFWRQTLKGFTAPTPLVLDQARKNIAHQHGTYDEYRFHREFLTDLYESIVIKDKDTEIVDIVIANGADINVCSGEPLYAAITRGFIRHVRLLLQHGARVLPRHIVFARHLQYPEILDCLLDVKYAENFRKLI